MRTPVRESFRDEELGQLVGLGRFELPTSPLSGVRSNQLSYRPKVVHRLWSVTQKISVKP